MEQLKHLKWACAILFLLCEGHVASDAFAASPEINIGNNVKISKTVKTLKDIRDENVVKQRFDYSCGAAALATLMKYYLHNDIAEADVLKGIFTEMDAKELELRKKDGFSLFDLKRFSEKSGYKAAGFKIGMVHLQKLSGPVIVYITPKDYKHFAVLKGVRDDRVYLADPSLGNVRMSVHKFMDMWLDANHKGIIFVVEGKDSQWTEDYPLKAPAKGVPQPELLTAREMLEVGSPYARYPHLSRW